MLRSSRSADSMRLRRDEPRRCDKRTHYQLRTLAATAATGPRVSAALHAVNSTAPYLLHGGVKKLQACSIRAVDLSNCIDSSLYFGRELSGYTPRQVSWGGRCEFC